MLDNRLDDIQAVESGTNDKIEKYRKLFIALDESLQELNKYCQTAHRQLHIARTHIETALMFTIKTICIQGEIKNY